MINDYYKLMCSVGIKSSNRMNRTLLELIDGLELLGGPEEYEKHKKEIFAWYQKYKRV